MSGVALLRGVLLLFVASLLSGCVTARTGFDYAVVMQKVGPPAAGKARIVFLNEKPRGYAAHAEVTVDGAPAGRLKPGTYVYADRPAGRHQILATEPLYMGETKYEITTAAGRTYFLIAKPTERYIMIAQQTMMGGITGALVATALTAGYKNPGPVDFFPLDDAAARFALTDLQLAE
jgi:hypothetical protein